MTQTVCYGLKIRLICCLTSRNKNRENETVTDITRNYLRRVQIAPWNPSGSLDSTFPMSIV